MSALTIAAQDSATMLGREIKHTLRFPLLIVSAILVPVVMLLLFDYLICPGLAVRRHRPGDQERRRGQRLNPAPAVPAAFPVQHFRAGRLNACRERPHVLGLSFGSGLALELYRWFPAIPRSLILASAYAGWAGSLPPDVVEQRKQGMLKRIDLLPQDWAREWIPTLLTESACAPIVDELTSILVDFHPEGQRALLRAGWAEHDAREVLAKIKVPTLLLYGDSDIRSPLDVAREMQANIPGSTLVVMEGVGHEGDMEASDRFNAEVRRFIRSVPN